MRCKSCQRRWKRALFAKTIQPSRGPKVTLRNTWAHSTPTFQACLGEPRVICRRGTLTQFYQRVASGRTRMYKDKQYMKGIQEFSSIISLPKSSSERSTRRQFFCRLLITSNNSVFQNKKDQDTQTWNDEVREILKGFRNQTTNWRNFFCQVGHGVTNDAFFAWQSLLDKSFSGFAHM